MKLLFFQFFFSSQAKILLSLTTQEYEQVLANCSGNLMLMGGGGRGGVMKDKDEVAFHPEGSR